MRKVLSTFMLFSLFALLVPMMPITTEAATATEMTAASRPCPAGYYRVSRKSKRSKRLVNALIAGGIGAAIGGGIGGGRGALLGAGAGSGGYFVYRYIKDRRGRCVPRYVRTVRG